MPPRRAPVKVAPVDRALARLKSLCAEVASAGAGAWSPTLASLHAAADDADVLTTDSTSCLWLAVGEDGLAPLLALYAVVLRRSGAPELSEELRSAHGALRSKIVGEMVLGSTPRDYATATTILRSHALRWYARLLADSWAQLSQRRSRRAVRAALSLLSEVYLLLGVLLSIGSNAAPELCNLKASLDDALRQELPASELLEHWARLLLLAAPPGEDAEEEAAVLLAGLTAEVLLVKHPVISACRSCLEGPCMSYLLSSHVVRLCAALDGGCSHGLGEEDVRHGAPLFDAECRALRQGSGQCVGASLARFTLHFWSNAAHLVRMADARRAEASTAGAASAPALMGSWQVQRRRSAQCRVLREQIAMTTAQVQAKLEAEAELKARTERCRVQMAGRMAVVRAGLAEVARGPEPPPPVALKALEESAVELEEELAAIEVVRTELVHLVQVDTMWTEVLRTDVTSVPPLHMQAVYRLAMRLVVCGVDGAAAAPPPPPPPPGAGGRRAAVPARRPRVAEAEALPLAVCALACARGASLCVARAAALQPRDQERLRGYWAAALRLAATLQQSTAASAALVSCVGDALKPQLPGSGPGATGLPPGPTPDVAAALAAGWVPGVELLLRNEQPGRRVHLRDMHGQRYDLRPEVCAQLLAFGAPREVAALLATTLKLADLPVPALTGAPPEGRAQALVAGLAHLALWASTLPVRWLAQCADAGQQLTGSAMAAGSATAAVAGPSGEAVTAASTAAAVGEGGPSGGDGLLAATAGPDSGAGGVAGVAGVNGAAGVAGVSGAAGVAGVSGAAGVAGVSGAAGVAGGSGAAGVAGGSGAAGVAGGGGAAGVAGGSGSAGVAGGSGAAGVAGGSGAAGVAGSSGAAGVAGVSGAAGVAGGGGAAGVAGGSGAAGVTGGGGAPQLRLLLSWVALCTLGPMARMLEDLLSYGPAELGTQAEEVGARLPLLAAPVLEWVASLAAAHRAAADAAIASGAQPHVAKAARAASADWQHLLQFDLGVKRVLGIGLRVAATQPDGTALPEAFVAALQGAVLALAHLHPHALMHTLSTANEAAAKQQAVTGAGGAAGPAGKRGPYAPTLQLLREVLGPGGACCELGVLAAVEAVRAQEGGGGSHGEGPAATGAAPEPLPPRLAELLAGGALLAAPADARALLPLCAYPRCRNLGGPSEAVLLCGSPCRSHCGIRCWDAHASMGLSYEGPAWGQSDQGDVGKSAPARGLAPNGR